MVNTHTHTYAQRDEHRNNTLVAPDDTTAVLLYVLSAFYFPFIPFRSLIRCGAMLFASEFNFALNGTRQSRTRGNIELFSIGNAVDVAAGDVGHRKSTSSAGWYGFCARMRSRLKSQIELLCRRWVHFAGCRCETIYIVFIYFFGTVICFFRSILLPRVGDTLGLVYRLLAR